MPGHRPMTRPRTPNTSSHAVLRIAARLGGFDAAATVARRSERCVRDWSDEATPSCPSWAQAVALDAAYRAAGGEGAPLYEAYGAQLDLRFNDLTACHAALATNLAEASREWGEAIGAATILAVPGFSPNQALTADIELDQAETRLKGLRRLVKRFLPDAVPGKPGGAQ